MKIKALAAIMFVLIVGYVFNLSVNTIDEKVEDKTIKQAYQTDAGIVYVLSDGTTYTYEGAKQ